VYLQNPELLSAEYSPMIKWGMVVKGRNKKPEKDDLQQYG
jgi:hypothetical protein